MHLESLRHHDHFDTKLVIIPSKDDFLRIFLPPLGTPVICPEFHPLCQVLCCHFSYILCSNLRVVPFDSLKFSVHMYIYGVYAPVLCVMRQLILYSDTLEFGRHFRLRAGWLTVCARLPKRAEVLGLRGIVSEWIVVCDVWRLVERDNRCMFRAGLEEFGMCMDLCVMNCALTMLYLNMVWMYSSMWADLTCTCLWNVMSTCGHTKLYPCYVCLFLYSSLKYAGWVDFLLSRPHIFLWTATVTYELIQI